MFGKKKNTVGDGTGNIAKERLKLMIDAKRQRLDDETLGQIRHEIGAIITKYVDIEPENVEIKIVLKDYRSPEAAESTGSYEIKRETDVETV